MPRVIATSLLYSFKCAFFPLAACFLRACDVSTQGAADRMVSALSGAAQGSPPPTLGGGRPGIDYDGALVRRKKKTYRKKKAGLRRECLRIDPRAELRLRSLPGGGVATSPAISCALQMIALSGGGRRGALLAAFGSLIFLSQLTGVGA